MLIAVTGANGLVGKNLIQHLLKQGRSVRALVRSPQKMTEFPAKDIYAWSTEELPPLESLSGVDVVVHLAGENIAGKRWTNQRKEQLRNSRLNGTKKLIEGIKQIAPAQRPRVFISASAIGYYGSHAEQAFDETSLGGNDFLAKLCQDWEAAANEAAQIGLRVVLMRLGLIFAKDGGFLSMAGPVVLGNGHQWISWVHVHDVCRFVEFSIADEKINGVYNLTSPEPITQKDLTKELCLYKGYPFSLPTPAFVIRAALGELAEAILASQKVLPNRTQNSGFRFQFARVREALENIYPKSSSSNR